MDLQTKSEAGVIIVTIEGHLDYEHIQELRMSCQELMKKENTNQLVLNMEKLRFVGSSGISQFIQVVAELGGSKRAKPKICQVSSEFRRMFEAFQSNRYPFEFFEKESEAVESFSDPQQNRGIKRRKRN